MITANQTPVIPEYQITTQLYSGLRTLVYRAFRESDQKTVVIKLLTSEYPNFNELLQFRNQYTISKNLNIPGIIHPLSLEVNGNSYILVMEDNGGISLREYIKITTLSLVEFLSIAIQLTNILHDLHQNRVIHKDIKPANILIHPETKEVKLIDFSIASLLPKETQEIKNPNVLEGTLAYISPEQTGRMNRGIDYRSDFYSLGVTFYELLIGKLPFISDDPMELLHCHIAQLPTYVSEIKSEIPQVISEIINKLMAKNAENRYQSTLGLKRDLENCLCQLKDTGEVSYFEIGKQDLCDRFLIPEKLYGREVEVEELLAAFERVSQGNSEMMLVAGFSGIGKTAIVNEVHKPIAKQRGYFIKGKFDQFNRNIPFSAFVQAFRNLIGQLLTESDAQLSNWKNKILQALGDNAQVIIDVIPELEKIIGKQSPAEELSGNTAQNRFNILFHKFIHVFATKKHPLVIFMDDLQWADMASLKLIKLLMSHTDTHYMLLIGAYRDNEVSSVHPLMLALQEIQQTQATINRITLNPLTKSDLNNLIADTLSCSLDISHHLTKLVFQKTKGNPFFANQFIKVLYEDGLISFNLDTGYWQSDIARVRTLALTDDIVQFMALQLQKLPTNTQEILKIAACIGNYFDLATLAIVSEKSQIEIANYLWKALQEGFVIPTSQVYKLFTDKSVDNLEQSPIHDSVSCYYKFLHDRVQQAAYCLIPEDQKHLTHLKLGQLLLSNIPAIEREERIFEIVNQLNIGIELINEQLERDKLAQLNLIAAKKAKLATAYSAAMEYLKIGRKLLADDCWESQYDLALYLHEIAAETAYLNGDFEAMEILGLIVIENAKNILDQVKIYEVQIQMYVAQNKLLASVKKGIEVLKILGLDLPDSPSQLEIQEAFEKTWSLFAGRDILELINQPLMTAPEKLAILRILLSISPASYIAIPSLYPLIILSQVDLSIQEGNAPLSGFAYASYGLILCGVLQDIESGYKFGRLALNLIEKLNTNSVRAKVFLLFSGFISHWQEHLNTSLTTLQDGYESALEIGDLEFASYCVFIRFLHEYFIGKELGMLEQEMANYSEILTKIKQQTALNWHQIYWQSVLNLIGNGENTCCLIGKAYDEDNMLLVHQQAGERSAIFYLYFNKLILCYLFTDYLAALENAILTEQYLDGVVSLVVVPIFYFYDSLVRLTLYYDASNSEQECIIIRVTDNQEKMQKWARHAPKNYLHKYYLVEAEKQRIMGDKMGAFEFYEQAIQGAKENKYIQEEALANELAAKFYLDWGKEKAASGYMQEAYYCYARWGAKAKIIDLEKRYPQLLAPILQQPHLTITSEATITATSMASVTSKSSSQNLWLDFAAVMKAAQAISQEIELEKLLRALMQIVITAAGAQIATLILRQDSQWLVITQVDKDETQRLEIPLDKYQQIPQSLIYSVARNGEVAVFENLSNSITFAGDPYIINHKPKSVLCTPISQQGKLIGILYLENNLTVGAFTSDRLQIIQILTAQAAISLENAQLYRQLENYSHTLEKKVQQRTEELTEKANQLESTLTQLYSTQAQLIQSEKMSSLGQLVAGVAHEINNPVNFIHGNLTYVEEYTNKLLSLFNLYQESNIKQRKPQDLKYQELLNTVDLEFIEEDLPKILQSMKLGTERISQIVLSLRNFSHLDEAEWKSVDIHEGINSTLMILQHRLQEKADYPAIKVIKYYSKLPNIECYAGQLNQVFMSIFSNAIDAIEEKNSKETIEKIKTNNKQIIIRTSAIDGRCIKIAIADNGVGISSDIQQRIFDPFFTTKPVGSGTGLGLSISYGIIKKHGGQLTCNSKVGSGTEFMIEIPLKT